MNHDGTAFLIHARQVKTEVNLPDIGDMASGVVELCWSLTDDGQHWVL